MFRCRFHLWILLGRICHCHAKTCKIFFHLPEGFKYEKAVPLLCSGITTFYPIEEFLNNEIKTTGVIGCGGLGHMAIKFLHKMVKHVKALSTSEKKLDLIKKL